MAVIAHRMLYCDRCKEAIMGDIGEYSTAQLRTMARDDGWVRVREKDRLIDICFDCQGFRR